MLSELTTKDNKEKIKDYINSISGRSERDRISDVKSVQEFYWILCNSSFFWKKFLWISDYVWQAELEQ